MPKERELDQSATAFGSFYPTHIHSIAMAAPTSFTSRSPSLAYKEAHDTLVFWLSQATFASLLASYIVGFVTVVGRHTASAPPDAPQVIDVQYTVFASAGVLNAIVVSLTYAFISTAIYLKYNMALLTMPCYRFDNLGRDFLFSVAQGTAFGLAIAWPHLLPILIALIVLLSLRIQRKEVNGLVSHLWATCVKERYEDKYNKRQSREDEKAAAQRLAAPRILAIINRISTEKHWDEWRPPTLAPFLLAWACLVVGLVMVVAERLVAFKADTYVSCFMAFSCLLNAILLIFVYIRTGMIIARSISFIDRIHLSTLIDSKTPADRTPVDEIWKIIVQNATTLEP